jgi:hypothetical protein
MITMVMTIFITGEACSILRPEDFIISLVKVEDFPDLIQD